MSSEFYFSLGAVCCILAVSYLACRRMSPVPGKLQNAVELLFGGIDEFVCGIIGEHGRKYTPFIGTLFIYILVMNLMGLIPFMKSPTADLSTTMALALCVFVYVQVTAFKELGALGYLDHLMGKPRGAMAFSVIIPAMMLFLHLISELVRPLSLSLRLRSNIWGEDMLIELLSGFGLKAVPLILFSFGIVIIGAVVQAIVFSLLATIYFAFIINHEE